MFWCASNHGMYIVVVSKINHHSVLNVDVIQLTMKVSHDRGHDLKSTSFEHASYHQLIKIFDGNHM